MTPVPAIPCSLPRRETAADADLGLWRCHHGLLDVVLERRIGIEKLDGGMITSRWLERFGRNHIVKGEDVKCHAIA